MTLTPTGLSEGGRSLWVSIAGEHSLNASQEVQLLEACRAKDRLDKLDELLRGEIDCWARLVPQQDPGEVKLIVSGALDKANATAASLKQLLAALRLPDVASGVRPQARGGARGAYAPSGAKVSSLDRARARSAG